MTRLPLILLFVATIAFALATLFSARYLRLRRNDDGFWASFCAFSGYVAFTLGGLVRVALAGFFPYGSFADALLVLVWVLSTAYMALELHWGLKGTGVFLFPVLALASGYALTLPVHAGAALPILRNPWVVVHVSLVLSSYAAFGLAGLMGALYLMQERQLKAKRLSFMHFSLPDLAMLSQLNETLITIGFPLLTIGIVFGSYWASRVWGSYLPNDPKLVWAILNWCFYAIYLLVRSCRGIGGRKKALVTLAGFLAIVVNYFGTSFLLHGLHRFF